MRRSLTLLLFFLCGLLKSISGYSQAPTMEISEYTTYVPFSQVCKDTAEIRYSVYGTIRDHKLFTDTEVKMTFINNAGQVFERMVPLQPLDSIHDYFYYQDFFETIGQASGMTSVTVAHLSSAVSVNAYDSVSSGDDSNCGILALRGFHDMDNDGIFNNADTIIKYWSTNLGKDYNTITTFNANYTESGTLSLLVPDTLYTLYGPYLDVQTSPTTILHYQTYNWDNLGLGQHDIPFTVTEETLGIQAHFLSFYEMTLTRCLDSPFLFAANMENNYDPATPVTFRMDFGDGTDTVIAGTAADVHYAFEHSFTTVGAFDLTATFTFPDTVIQEILHTTAGINCGMVSGRIFKDLDLTCTNSAGDEGLNYVMIYGKRAQDNPINILTDDEGYFDLMLDTTAGYFLFPSYPNYEWCTDTIFIDKPTEGIDFALHCEPDQFDLKILGGSWPIRPGFKGEMVVNAFNKGCNTVPATVTAVVSDKVTVTGGNPQPDQINGNTVIWNLPSTYIQDHMSIYFDIPASLPLGDTVCLFTAIESSELGETDPNNNTHYYCETVRGSYDPNDKTAFVNGLAEQQDIEVSDYLLYRIRFQNSGTDTAFNITVRDTIDQNLDLSTFQIVGSSHTMKANIRDNRVIDFRFDNILLPDDKTNEPGSHGDIYYTIKPKASLKPGDSMKNTAYIYFDFNSAIITNTTFNQIRIPNGVKEVSVNRKLAWPNPTRDLLHFNREDLNSEINISDLSGRMVKQFKLSETTVTITDLVPGTYILQLKKDSVTSAQRIVIQR